MSEEYFGADSSSIETSSGSKRKRDDEEELDDQLSEENLGCKIKDKKTTLVRVKRIDDDESDDSQNQDEEKYEGEQKIQKTDMPERMQLRNIPITSVGSDELESEVEWIFKHGFSKASISNQDGTADGREDVIKGKIRNALEFIRNQHFEVPFIAFYRKEYVLPELSVNDLWKVHKFDEKWTKLQTRKNNMMRLFKKMQKYQSEKLTQNLTKSIPKNVRVLKDEDIDTLRMVQSSEELSDVYNHFTLYYGNDVPAMREEYRRRKREEAKERRSSAARRRLNDLGEDLRDPDDVNADLYSRGASAGLDGLLRKYGLSRIEQFADNYQRHDIHQSQTTKDPCDVALEYAFSKFPNAAEFLKAANYMLAVQIAKEPSVRKFVRESFFERARFDVIPTKEGLKKIDEMHDLYSLKFLKNKPVRDLVNDQFLRLWVAEQDKLLTIVFQTKIDGATTASYLDDMKSLLTRDESSKLVQEWDDLRKEIIDLALSKFVLPSLVKELKEKLLNEAQDFVKRACCQQLYNWLNVAPYEVNFRDNEGWDTENGITVLGLSYGEDKKETVYGCLIKGDGELSNQIRLEHILNGTTAEKEKTLKTMKNFISSFKPHGIAVSAESKEAIMLVEKLRAIISELVKEKKCPMINVVLVDNSLAKVCAKSTRADFPQDWLFGEAITIARVLQVNFQTSIFFFIQDPLIAYSQLCNADKDILNLKYHPLQYQLSKEELFEGLYLEFVNRTNEVGVDINRAIKHPRTAHLIQFICGLGPRKADDLMKTLKNQRLENRSQLETACHMGPKVFTNCAGFIKIDTHLSGDGAESQVEVLDGSRVHPEIYHWARNFAVAALKYHGGKDVDPDGAVKKILEAPKKLEGLDLDALAAYIEHQGYGNTRITLESIRSELLHLYKDGRPSYQAPSHEEDIFNMITKETPQTFYKGKMVLATVTGFQRRKPKREELDKANPKKNETTGLWQCPFCLQNDFTDLSEVWNHFDAGSCSGQAIGVSICLENGLSGFLPMKCLSDSNVTNPEERVRLGQTIHCRITKINFEDFSVDVTSRSSDLNDINGVWRPPKDPFYDGPAEKAMLKAEEDAKKLRQRNTESVVVHPASNTSNTTERRSGGPSSRSRSRSPNRGRTARTIGSSSRSRSPLHQSSPLRRPSPRPPALPPVGAPAPSLIVAPPWFHNMQCPHFRDHSQCPRGNLCPYVTGPYQPDLQLMEALDMPGRDPPQNPQ
ncbi:transcription elongation factor SPT6-like [Daphnia pulicaria]|uniref:transcription elongation factor SPT6-like n=1 Tax=Daphnia pulicaria TaxID=35523 RepID=UPI001EECAA7B|nr:transcription elongation factor SPT6-like [Daphnia pulicaria]